MAFIGDLDSDMFMAKLWDQPDFIFLYIYIYIYFFFFTSLMFRKEYSENTLKVEN